MHGYCIGSGTNVEVRSPRTPRHTIVHGGEKVRVVAFFQALKLRSILTTSTGRFAAAASTVPWREWKLDKTFFQALSRYTVDNPEATLPHVLDNVIKGLEANQAWFLLIPNAPFPARDLIQALAHLVKLGVVCY